MKRQLRFVEQGGLLRFLDPCFVAADRLLAPVFLDAEGVAELPGRPT